MALRIYTFALSPFCFSLSSFQYWSSYHHLLITSITLTISSSITWCVPTYLYISLMTKVSTLRFHQLFKTKLELSPAEKISMRRPRRLLRFPFRKQLREQPVADLGFYQRVCRSKIFIYNS
jgi:hypothetical protein